MEKEQTGERIYTEELYGEKQKTLNKLYAMVTLLIMCAWYPILLVLLIFSYFYTFPRCNYFN